MRYIRVLSELSNQMRYTAQKRVLIEMALIRLTKPQMEHNLDSIIQRLNDLESRSSQGEAALSPEVILQMAAKLGGGVSDHLGEKDNKELSQKSSEEIRQVVIPKAQLEDLKTIQKDWMKIIRELGGAIRPAFRETILEPAGDNCLCIVFSSEDNYIIGNRNGVLEELKTYIRQRYGKDLDFKARKRNTGEQTITEYVSDEDLKNAIHHIDVVEED